MNLKNQNKNKQNKIMIAGTLLSVKINDQKTKIDIKMKSYPLGQPYLTTFEVEKFEKKLKTIEIGDEITVIGYVTANNFNEKWTYQFILTDIEKNKTA